MEHEVRCHRILERFDSDLKPFQASGVLLPVLQAHSSLRSYQLSACHPQIAQRKQRYQLRRVLGKALVAHLGKPRCHLQPCYGGQRLEF